MSTLENGMKVTPGQFLGYIYDFSIGERGIFQKEDKLYSSLSGKLIISQKDNKNILSVESFSKNNKHSRIICSLRNFCYKGKIDNAFARNDKA